MTTLKRLPVGKSAEISSVGGQGALRRHLLDMGIIPGTIVTVKKYAPMGDPMEVMIRGYELTLRKADASKIKIKKISSFKSDKNQESFKSEIAHPGLGEGGKYHNKAKEKPLPDETILTFALVGNQNSGKTTLFNHLTGSKQHVGNFPGVTVTRKDGMIKGKKNTVITDLPGIYSMSPYSNEEIVTREFILNEKPNAIINIVDATNIERNLYLTMQLMELNVPMVLALNMMDEVRNNGGTILINEMEQLLGIPVVPISASFGEGTEELIAHALHVAKYQEKPQIKDFCEKDENGGAVHRCLHAISHLIEDHALKSKMPVRFSATKLVEGDELVFKKLRLDGDEKSILEKLICQMEKERCLDRVAAMADMRFSFIQKVCRQTVKTVKGSKEYNRSQMIDSVLTGKYTALPAFISIMALIFWLNFGVIGVKFQEMFENVTQYFIDKADYFLTSVQINETLRLLLVDGVLTGVGSVLSFLPLIVMLFFFLALLEDSGYIARIAFVMDKLLRKLGLSGRSIVPMLIGFGCTVPAVMATRTLPSERDRKMTILLTPFMSCTAKLPIYAFFTAVFFPTHATLVMTGLYLLGIIVSIFVAFLFKETLFKGQAVPFVMELPNYRLPTIRNVSQLLWEKSKDFIQKAFTIIFIATILVWFLQTFNWRMEIVADAQNSILAEISGWIAPLFKPLGLNDWRLSSALITGFLAKESVVSTISVLIGDMNNLKTILSPVSALSMLVFCLLYVPCVASIGAIKRELGAKWAWITVFWQCTVAFVVAYIVRVLCLFFGVF